eukprot:13999983-Alexandrium_andersonii.AAC.1
MTTTTNKDATIHKSSDDSNQHRHDNHGHSNDNNGNNLDPIDDATSNCRHATQQQYEHHQQQQQCQHNRGRQPHRVERQQRTTEWQKPPSKSTKRRAGL